MPCPVRLECKGVDQCELLVQLALVVLMVTLIHFIEAYGLNPAIYSAHLKLHPLLVLTVLVVAEHSLGVWGLLLAGNGKIAVMSHTFISVGFLYTCSHGKPRVQWPLSKCEVASCA